MLAFMIEGRLGVCSLIRESGFIVTLPNSGEVNGRTFSRGQSNRIAVATLSDGVDRAFQIAVAFSAAFMKTTRKAT